MTLGQLNCSSAEAITVLLKSLHDADKTICRTAALSLGQLGRTHSEARSALLEALHTEDPVARYYAALGLGKLERGRTSGAVMRALLDALHDNDQEVRYQAAQSLVQLGQASPEIVATLFEALRSTKSWSQHANVVRLLGYVGSSDPSTIEVLLQQMLDTQAIDGQRSAQALTLLGRRFPETADVIARRLVQVIEDPQFLKIDNAGRPLHERAYDGLWLLMVGGEIEDIENR